MGKVSLDLSSLKAAGIYTLEIDNSARQTDSVESLRMLVGYSNKGPFNRPVLLETDADRLSIFGDVDTKLEHKGCYFNRMLRTMLDDGAVVAMNLLNVNNRYDGPDQVNFAALSLDSAKENPRVEVKMEKYGQYDYLAETTDNTIYGTVKGDVLPYVGTTPYSSLYDRSRFWIPDKDLLSAAAARGLATIDFTSGRGTYEYTNLINFANVGTEEFSILVFKADNVLGYDVTADAWYGGEQNIPYGWIRPYDYISDYFIQVVCVKGNWSNYSTLSTDNIWKKFFDANGIIKSKINNFIGAEGVTVIGSWTGCIIPDFVDKQGVPLSIERKINASTERTGLLMSFNNDAANVLTYDYSGFEVGDDDPDQGVWGIDIDGNGEIENGESGAPYIVDMVGHGAFMPKADSHVEIVDIDITTPTIQKGYSVTGTRNKAYNVKADIVQLSENPNAQDLVLKDTCGVEVILDSSLYPGVFVEQNVVLDFNPQVDSSLFTDNNLLNFINKNYYIISESGAIRNSQISTAAVRFDYEQQPNSEVGVVANLYYSDVYSQLKFVVTTDVYGNITNINAKDAKLSISLVKSEGETYYGVNFLSYNYIAKEDDGVQLTVGDVAYFADKKLWKNECPVNEDNRT